MARNLISRTIYIWAMCYFQEQWYLFSFNGQQVQGRYGQKKMNSPHLNYLLTLEKFSGNHAVS
jgi:hypothetical protein